MGAGRTELLQSIFGLYPDAASGEVYVDGRIVKIRCPRDAIRAGLALAPEDRKAEGLVLSMGVAENVALAAMRDIVRYGWLSPKNRNALAREFTQRLQLRAASLDQTTRDLSGGNQQKVVLAKWLATRPKVLLLDEPTRGIDVGAKREIYGLIDELAKSGLAVLMVSSELPEILAMADRILVLSEGRITREFGRDEATEEAVLHAALPTEGAVL
jgi:ribose transport system ATP-binding protein